MLEFAVLLAVEITCGSYVPSDQGRIECISKFCDKQKERYAFSKWLSPKVCAEKKRKEIVPKFSPQEVRMQYPLKLTLQMVGDCENLSQTNKAWYEYCDKNYEKLHPKFLFEPEKEYIRACPWKKVSLDGSEKFKMRQGHLSGLDMVDTAFGERWPYTFDLSKTIVSFRYDNRDFALNVIVPLGSEIQFIYKTIDEGTKKQILIVYDVYKLFLDEFRYRYAPKSHFKQDDCPLKAMKEVYYNSRNSRLFGGNDEITAGFKKNAKPKFYPEFAQTLLKKQRKQQKQLK